MLRRGNTIKYVCVPDEVLEVVKEDMKNRPPVVDAVKGVDEVVDEAEAVGVGGRGGDARRVSRARVRAFAVGSIRLLKP